MGGRAKGTGVFRGGARSIAIDKTGDLYVLDFNSVQKFTPAGEFLARWKTQGSNWRVALPWTLTPTSM